MSHYSEHQRMKPVLDLARRLDIATNPSPQAIFEAGNGGFQVWCTPQDRPPGWSGIVMDSGAFSKPCEYVGSVLWKWDDHKIIAIQIDTTAYALADQKPEEYCNLVDIPEGFGRRTIFNRDEDIEWIKEKVAWLFAMARVPLPPFEYEQTSPSNSGPYVLAHYASEEDQYVVIVASGSNPEEFCRPGYQVARTLEISNAEGFPTNVILRPEQESFEAEVEPDEGPLVKHHEKASRLGDDGWLEAAFEDSISGSSE